MPGAVSINVDVAGLERLALAAERFPEALQDELRARLGEVAEDVAGDARRNALALRLPGRPPARRPQRRHTGLRAALAAGVRVSSSAGEGVTYRITSTHRLTRATNSEYFRHPVFGNRRVWAGQASQPWFDRARRDRGGAVRAAGEQALENAAQQVL